MERKKWLAGLVLVGMTMAVTAQQAPSAQRPAKEAAAPAAARGGDGLRQGITVHGHWVINVRDAKGNIVEHRDFENALQPTGASVLIELLIGSMTPGNLRILAQHTDSNGNTEGGYFLFPAGGIAQFQTFCASHVGICSYNLAATPVSSTANPPNQAPYSYYSGLTLQGSFKAVAAISIDNVYTFFNGCQSPLQAWPRQPNLPPAVRQRCRPT